jgi:hypothetical protein
MSVVVPLLFIAAMASLISAALRIPRDHSFMPADSAARSVARYLFSPSGHPACQMYPTVDSALRGSLAMSTNLPARSAWMSLNPVALRPGRDRLSTNPIAIGLPTLIKTMGTVGAKRCAATDALDPHGINI